MKFGGINQDKAYFSCPKSFNAKCMEWTDCVRVDVANVR